MNFLKIRDKLYNADKIIKLGFCRTHHAKVGESVEASIVISGVYVQLDKDVYDEFKTDTPEEAYALMAEIEKLIVKG